MVTEAGLGRFGDRRLEKGGPACLRPWWSGPARVSGGWAVAGIHTEPRECDDQGGCSEGSSTLAAAPRPDGDPEQLTMAWYLDRTVDDGNRVLPTGDRLAVVGPRTATQVRLVGDNGDLATVPLPTGAGLVRQGDVRSVEFLDAAGRSLGDLEVTPPWQIHGRLGEVK